MRTGQDRTGQDRTTLFTHGKLISQNYKNLISHRKEIRKLTFRAQALRRSESRNCGLCVVYIQKYGATLLVGAWQRENKRIN